MHVSLEKISILMPAYNASTYIYESIKSVIDQTYSDWELIICNDGSLDNTLEIVDQFQDNRIITLSNPENMGIGYTRNRLLSQAMGKYIAWCDADDVFEPTKLEKQLHYLINNPDIFAVGSTRTDIDRHGNTIKKHTCKNFTTCIPFYFLKSLQINQFTNSSLLFRNTKDKLIMNALLAPAEDYEFNSRNIVLLKRHYAFLQVPYVKYRVHPLNSSRGSFEKNHRQFSCNIEICKRNFEFFFSRKLPLTFIVSNIIHFNEDFRYDGVNVFAIASFYALILMKSGFRSSVFRFIFDDFLIHVKSAIKKFVLGRNISAFHAHPGAFHSCGGNYYDSSCDSAK